MITKEQVEKFLEDFSLKVKIFGIRFRDDRQKNQNSLVDLGITPNQRMEVIMNLNCYDYSEGPIVDALNNQGDVSPQIPICQTNAITVYCQTE